jgi:lipoprotein-anchoring transpeptidase ErfK/SrfK
VRLGKGTSALNVSATGSAGTSATVARYVTRIEWPYDTCIVIDKSDYRLYWVKNQQIVSSYKIAHGRHNWTPTRVWKILAKYKTDPHSVYGPRKMRMFKRIGSAGHYRYVFTRYAIHGTNQPSSIGHQASHGCIRMYSSDVLKLWPQVPIGTYVVTRP